MSHECVFVAPRPLFPSRHASNALCSHGSGPVVFCFPPTATVLVRADWLLFFCLRGLRLVLGVAVEPVHLDAIMHELDTDGDGDIVIAEFFEQMERLKLKMNAARKLALKQGEEERRRVGFPWSRAGVERALSSVGGTIAAAHAVCARLHAEAEEIIGTKVGARSAARRLDESLKLFREY